MSDRLGSIDTQYFDDAGDPLVSGRLYFYESGTTTPKNTYADINETIPNTNPVILSGAGVPPNIFYSGSAKVILTDGADVQVRVLDPVGSSTGGAFSDWEVSVLYTENELVEGSDGNYYKSLSSNQGNDPTTDTVNWTRVQFVETWNVGDSYSIDDVVQGSDGFIYVSLANLNVANDPISDTVNWGSSSASVFSVGDVVLSGDKTKYVAPAFLKCNGEAYSSVTYSDLFDLIGGAYTVLPDPATLPSNDGFDSSWSSDDTYMAIASQGTPYILIYKRAGDVFTILPDPATLPGTVGYGCSFSSDDTYLAVGSNGAPYLTVYKRALDIFTKLLTVTVTNADAVNNVQFSNNTEYVATALQTTPWVSMYKRAGDVFSTLSDPAALPTGIARGCAWDNTDTYLAIAHNASPHITIYKRNVDLFEKLPNPAELPANTAHGVSFNHDGSLLAVGTSGSASFLGVTIYSRSGDVFTKVGGLYDLPPDDVFGVDFNSDGTRMSALVGGAIDGVMEYKVDGENFTLLKTRDVNPTGVTTNAKIRYSSTDEYQSTGDISSPHLHIYKNSPILPDIQVDGNGLTDAYIKTGL